MNIQQIIDSLKELGFTEYEAKIYLALIRSHPANGNAIAVLSGVPTPKVYETIRKMQERDVIFTVSGGDKGKKVRYSPLPYKDLLQQKKEAFSGNVDFLSKELTNISSMSDTNWTELFVIHGYSSSMEAVESAIAHCESEIVMSCWCEELYALKAPLTEAYNRGISIVTLTFDEGNNTDVLWRNFKHYGGDIASHRHTGELSIVTDQSKAIILQSLNNSPHAVVSSHPVTISTTRNYIRHDIYVNRILHDFEGVMKKKYGQDLENLIKDF
ncbi:TrmB family transcriptional regulator [Virgibacillus salinus]|uniref:Sugar-specific transcriptional regulator TrmB n=1 Tax=Virgibacillus salinus TaxID=553311 RepID=A0A1H0YNP1_9BACI|nr:helix-turn-helix domain-containing protein [Virgibacillus salinus]SDQ16718.1 Sugar-specific transcriptional regulator TrmB [Virgibacillus salinus]